MAREVFTSPDSAETGYYKSILDAAGVICYIRNEYADNPALAGETYQPTLCVVDDGDYDEAVRILQACRPPEVAGSSEWICPACQEKNPANFELCWSCSAARPVS